MALRLWWARDGVEIRPEWAEQRELVSADKDTIVFRGLLGTHTVAAAWQDGGISLMEPVATSPVFALAAAIHESHRTQPDAVEHWDPLIERIQAWAEEQVCDNPSEVAHVIDRADIVSTSFTPRGLEMTFEIPFEDAERIGLTNPLTVLAEFGFER